MKRYEYKTMMALFHKERKLNQLAEYGWELIAVDGGTMYLRREIDD